MRSAPGMCPGVSGRGSGREMSKVAGIADSIHANSVTGASRVSVTVAPSRPQAVGSGQGDDGWKLSARASPSLTQGKELAARGAPGGRQGS
eukprot:3879101-Rhodomonas_salina.1